MTAEEAGGACWCYLVRFAVACLTLVLYASSGVRPALPSSVKMTPKKKRLSISLEAEDHKVLKRLAEAQHPKLSMQYLIGYAVGRFVEEARQPGFELRLESRPRGGGRSPSDANRSRDA